MLPHKFQYIQDNYITPKGIGTSSFADAIQWANCLVEPFEILEKQPRVFLDYGCADGRLANFLASRIKDFKYFGLEHPDSVFNEHSNSVFFRDSRCHFGQIGSTVENEALESSQYVTLGSVFTHLKVEDFEIIMEKFKNIIMENEGQVVFSIFIDKSYRWENHFGVYNVANCISRVFYTEKMIQDFAKSNKYKLTEHKSFLAQGENLHRIFKVTK